MGYRKKERENGVIDQSTRWKENLSLLPLHDTVRRTAVCSYTGEEEEEEEEAIPILSGAVR